MWLLRFHLRERFGNKALSAIPHMLPALRAILMYPSSPQSVPQLLKKEKKEQNF